MKYVLIIIGILLAGWLFFWTMGEAAKEQDKTNQTTPRPAEPERKLVQIDIEGCSYAAYENGKPSDPNYAVSIAHKGNCPSCWNRLVKMLQTNGMLPLLEQTETTNTGNAVRALPN